MRYTFFYEEKFLKAYQNNILRMLATMRAKHTYKENPLVFPLLLMAIYCGT